ncbi:MAG: hypothetical protein B6243_08595 [Anaerolineaceae bacterium 4572_5.2]|nr:MAG: hypothetical protein B6243_08595 [Anaerolineaceae bacterium 4572_5.2]
MKKIDKMNAAELSAYVQSHLMQVGIEVVLSGGSAVTIYSQSKYVSKDLDLVNIYASSHKKIKALMLELGFQEDGRYFAHSDTHLFIEFPAGPLAIGEEAISNIVEKEMDSSPVGAFAHSTGIYSRADKIDEAFYERNRNWFNKKNTLQHLQSGYSPSIKS